MKLIALGLTLFALPLAASATRAANLVSHFTFDSDFTNAVSSSLDSPSQSGASIDNTTFKVGGGAVLFDGGTTPEYVNAGVDALPNANGPFYAATVALWFKAGPNESFGNRALMGQTNGNPATFGSDNRMAFLLETASNGKLRVFLRAHDGLEGNNRLRFSPDQDDPADFLKWADGEWNHLAYAWEIDNLGASTTKMFVNGVEIPTIVNENTLETVAGNATLLPWEDPGMFIGAQNNRTLQGGGAAGHVNGWIDDLRIYDGVLSLSEIRALPGVIPEPTTLLLIAGAAGGSLFARRRNA
jgi:hypothetical protein